MAEIVQSFASLIDHVLHNLTTYLSHFMVILLTLFRANQRHFEVAGKGVQFR